MTVIKIKRDLLLLTLLVFPQLVLAQSIEFKNSNFKKDKEELKVAKENIKIADEFRKTALLMIINMQDATLEFEKAIFYYQMAQNLNSNNAELNYKIGSSLLFTNRKELAKEEQSKKIARLYPKRKQN